MSSIFMLCAKHSFHKIPNNKICIIGLYMVTLLTTVYYLYKTFVLEWLNHYS